jgi:predicted RNase H-like nuclease (RuvC/YqgF family)
MKIILAISFLMSASQVLAGAGTDFGYLKKEDQEFYKNDSMEGSNKMERIDSTVKEINKLHSEIKTLKSEMAQLKLEVELLKSKK